MKIKIVVALSIATAAALPLSAAANACGGGEAPPDDEFVTPSGNIICDIYSDGSGVGCEIRDRTWVVPASINGPFGRECNLEFGGLEFYVSGASPEGWDATKA